MNISTIVFFHKEFAESSEDRMVCSRSWKQELQGLSLVLFTGTLCGGLSMTCLCAVAAAVTLATRVVARRLGNELLGWPQRLQSTHGDGQLLLNPNR